MSNWPDFEVPSWKAFEKNESYGSSRNWVLIPVSLREQRQDHLLEGLQRAVLEAADDHLARCPSARCSTHRSRPPRSTAGGRARRAAARAPTAGGEQAGRSEHTTCREAGLDEAAPRQRQLLLLLALHLRPPLPARSVGARDVPSVYDGRAIRGEEARSPRIDGEADGRAERVGRRARRPHHHARLADGDVDERLGPHRLDHEHRARQCTGRARVRSGARSSGRMPIATACRSRHSVAISAGSASRASPMTKSSPSMAPSSTLIGGLPTNVATNRFAGRS